MTHSTSSANSQLPPFSVTWDYRCPFARNVHEHLVAALEGGAPFEVTFLGFSLSETHRSEDEPSVFDEPEKDSGSLALQVGIVVRDKFPESFLAVHRSLFALRHDEGGDLRDADALRAVLTRHEVDADAVFAEVEKGWALETLRREHEEGVANHSVFGVPTFIVGDQAVFVRVMTRPTNGEEAAGTIERVVTLLGSMPELNEFKHTSIPR